MPGAELIHGYGYLDHERSYGRVTQRVFQGVEPIDLHRDSFIPDLD